VLASISRVMGDVITEDQVAVKNRLLSLMAVYRKAEDLINIGAYVEGKNPRIDEAIQKMPAINAFLCQRVNEKVDFCKSLNHLKSLFN
jgi:flagellum-specific ATP synthase